MSHTPGPWNLETVETSLGTCHKIGPFPSLGVYPQTHACMYADNVRLTDYGNSAVGDELLANARLIAAAPELLELVDDLRGRLAAFCIRYPSVSESEDWAAINKAGELLALVSA